MSTGCSAQWPATAVAVIGMAGRFPGAANLEAFWANLRDGVESIRPLSESELVAAGVDPALLVDPQYVKAAAVLDGVDLFDAAFFGFSPHDAAIMDPQHRVFLECAWEALEDAGCDPERFEGSIGVYAGSGMNSYLIFNLLANPDVVRRNGLFLLKQTGNDKDVLATRVSYHLNLTGPSVTIQTACSTSLVAVHIACQSLLHRECDLALAGGVTIELPHGVGYVHRPGEILSRDGHCRAFDADASGTVFGSGAGLVVLRRLDDALAAGDSIRAVIRGTAVNNDGARKVGYLAPSVDGQAEAILEALDVAEVEAESIQYIEAHGTGTAVGDPIEIAALTLAFGRTTPERGICRIGSVKTNIGHLDAAAGIAGLIKTVLALEHREVPPSLNYRRPNPLIDFDSSPFQVNGERWDWQSPGRPRRAGVTSLGIGGTNAHVVLQEAPEPPASTPSRPLQLLTLAARTASALDQAAVRLADHLERHRSVDLADVAYTLHVGRRAFAHRRALVCGTVEDAVQRLRAIGAAGPAVASGPAGERRAVFLFPGQGSQYPQMARRLYETEESFRADLDAYAARLSAPLGIDLRAILFPERGQEDPAALAETRITQPVLFAVELALARLWIRWGVDPTAMIGHSLGEYVAACVAGVFTPDEALDIVAIRAQLMQSAPPGAMIAMAVDEPRAERLAAAHGVSVAAVNGPDQCVLSGPDEAIREIEQEALRQEIMGRRLATSHAFHSRLMDPVLEPFAAALQRIPLRAPAIPYVSNVSGRWITPGEATDPEYWAHHLRSTVRFADGLQELLSDPRAIGLEVGPGRTLTNLSAPGRAIASLGGSPDRSDDLTSMLAALGALWIAGVAVDWSRFHAGERRRRVPLPTYPFERRRYWIDSPRVLPAAGTARPEREGLEHVEYYRPVWRRRNGPSRAQDRGGRWLVLADDLGLGDALAAAIRRAGGAAMCVRPGSRFERLEADCCTIRPLEAADYERLIAETAPDPRATLHIAHLWSVISPDRSDTGAPALEQTEALAFWSLVHLAGALGRHEATGPIRLSIVTNDLQSVSGEPIHAPVRALVAGPARVIPREYPDISVRHIDVALAGRTANLDRAGLAEQLVAELAADWPGGSVALRGDEAFCQAVEPVALQRRATVLRRRGVYLITGGLGDLALAVADLLAREYQARLVLVARTDLPPRQEWSALAGGGSRSAERIRRVLELERHGAEVLCAAADVASLEQVQEVVRQAMARFGRLDGVIHAAGAIDDELMQFKTIDRARRVLDPKVRGALVLERALEGVPIDFVLLFSSISSLLPPIGQVDYAAANAVLDAFATAARVRGRPWLALDWGRWSEIGLAARGARPPSGARPAPDNPDRHPLLGGLIPTPDDSIAYRVDVDCTDWVAAEHRLRNGNAVFPGTGHIELARAAGRRLFGPGPIEIRRLAFSAPLIVGPGAARRLEFTLAREGEGYGFSTREPLAAPGAPAEVYATGSLRRIDEPPPRIDVAGILRRAVRRSVSFLPERQNAAQARHIEFGPRWRCLVRLHLGDGEALAELELPADFANETQRYHLHPALLDIATGSAMLSIPGYDGTPDLYVPIGYGRLAIYADLPPRCWCHVRGRSENRVDRETAVFDLIVVDEEGRAIVAAEDFALRRLPDASVLSPGSARSSGGHAPAQSESAVRPGLSTADGVAAFSAVMCSGLGLPQLIVTAPGTVPADAFLAAAPTAEGGGLAPPRPAASVREPEATGVEGVLVDWWKELLGVEQVGSRDHFFELGGHSLLAARLLNRVEQRFKKAIPLHAFLQAPTIEALLNEINGQRRGDFGSIVTLTPGAGAPVLYCVHSIGGDAVSFRHLAKALGPDQPLCGIVPAPADITPGFASSIEAMAARYVRDLTAYQPEGPYVLSGWSVGSAIALEMAQQLAASGRTVSLLVAFDGAPHNTGAGTAWWNPAYAWRLLRNLPLWVADDLLPDFSAPQLARRVRNKLRALSRQGIAALGGGAAADRVSGFMETEHLPAESVEFMNALFVALRRYVPRPYAGRVLLYQARTEPLYHLFEADRAWRTIAADLEIVRVRGTHVSLLRDPYVQMIAADLRRRLSAGGAPARSTADRPVQALTVSPAR